MHHAFHTKPFYFLTRGQGEHGDSMIYRCSTWIFVLLQLILWTTGLEIFQHNNMHSKVHHHVIYNTSSHAILTVVHSSRLLQSALAVDEQRTTQISVDYLSSLLGRIVGRTLVIISASSIKHQLSSTTIIPILLTTLLSPLPPLSQHAEPTQVSCTYGPLAPCA